jgi:hypothetical protein
MSQNDVALEGRLQALEAENRRLKRLNATLQQRYEREEQMFEAPPDLATPKPQPAFSPQSSNYQLGRTPTSRLDGHGAVPRAGPGIIVPTKHRRPVSQRADYHVGGEQQDY